MKPFCMLLLTLILAGCAHDLSVISKVGGQDGKGVAEESGKKVSLLLEGKVFEGFYVFDEGASTNAYSGAPSSGTVKGAAYVPGSGNGRIVATSDDGDVIRCEFAWKSGGGLGACTDSNERNFDLIIHN